MDCMKVSLTKFPLTFSSRQTPLTFQKTWRVSSYTVDFYSWVSSWTKRTTAGKLSKQVSFITRLNWNLDPALDTQEMEQLDTELDRMIGIFTQM
jgi:hypothetical protein